MTGNLEALDPGFGMGPGAEPSARRRRGVPRHSSMSEGSELNGALSPERRGWGPAARIEERGEQSNGGIDRRRSDRIAVAVPVRLRRVENVKSGLEGEELANMVELSLGGATLETASRPPLYVPRRLSLGFGETAAELTIQSYHCWLHQLFYAPSRSSRVLYRVRVTFQDPSVPALNLIYRILLAHWNGEGY